MKNAFIETWVVCLCAFLFSSSAAFGEERDASRGSALFRDQCALCHINEGRGGQGPNLRGIVGRKPASTDFSYSEALKAVSWIWSEGRLDRFLENPSGLVP